MSRRADPAKAWPFVVVDLDGNQLAEVTAKGATWFLARAEAVRRWNAGHAFVRVDPDQMRPRAQVQP